LASLELQYEKFLLPVSGNTVRAKLAIHVQVADFGKMADILQQFFARTCGRIKY
jgi:hypothetical protein